MAGTSIVVVDDTPAIRDVLRDTVEIDGRLHVVGEAENGEEGVRLAAELQPDAVVLDVHMPVMGGFEALPLIRAAVPDAVIVVWSSGMDVGAEHALHLGATSYFTKAVSPARLVEHIALHLRSTPGA
ncbi:MAG: two-component response regulator [Acidimicrobiales bacterium]|nr:two-component response regulator [Acidimicrobiales bacterium]